MKTVIINGTILTPDEEISGHHLVIEDELIVGIEPARPVDPEFNTLDARGFYVTPGLIDIHMHGTHGFDTMDATPEAILAMGRFIAKSGVTSYLPTTVTASAEATLLAILNVESTPRPRDGAQHLGIHLEGPYLNQAYCGAQPVQFLRAADPNEYQLWLENKVVRMITVASEVPGIPELIRAGQPAGIEFALGHSAATYEQALAAAELGARQATHIFNGMPALNHRSPGVLGAVLSDERVRAQLIVDGIHVHPAIVKLVVRAKGVDGTILITDAIRATGMPDGDYTLGDNTVHVNAGIARTDAGGLAGSTLTLDQALRNTMEFTGLSLRESLPMATRVPAAALGLQGRRGLIAPDCAADIIFLDETYAVRMSMVSGQVVYCDF
jgi:N-acetylglucosamine-6-phosphate deacetylase